jgi:hypothetical protein
MEHQAEQDEHREFHIFVNGKPRETKLHHLDFEECVKLAFPNETRSEHNEDTVTCTEPDSHKVELVKGSHAKVKVENGLSISVVPSNRS